MSIDRSTGCHITKTVKAQRCDRGANLRQFNAGGFTQNISVYNFTDKTIYVKTQGNIPFAVTPLRGKVSGSTPQSHVEIRVNNGVQTNADFAETLNLANRVILENIPTSLEAKDLFEKMQQMLESEAVIGRHNGVNDTNFFIVPERDIQPEGFSFIRECNLLLSFSPSLVMEHHPQSNEAWSAPDVRSYAEARQAAGNFVRIIDNDNLRDKWYYYSAKQLVEVTATRDKSKDSGVYYSRLIYEDGMNRVETEYMNFDEAEARIGVYATQEAAMTNGNPEKLVSVEDSRYKAELERTKRELEVMKHNTEQMKARHDMELSRVKFEASIAKENIDMASTKRKDKLDERSTERKDKFEERTTKRKDTYDKKEKRRKNRSEETSLMYKTAEAVVKSAPLILTGISMLALGLAVGKSREKSLLPGICSLDHYSTSNPDCLMNMHQPTAPSPSSRGVESITRKKDGGLVVRERVKC